VIATFIISAVYASGAVNAPETFEQKIPNSLAKFEMARIPAGEGKQDGKSVPVKSLWIGRTEVTWDVYDIWAFRRDLDQDTVNRGHFDANARPSRPYGAADRGFGHAGYPALGMTARSADLFCKWLSEKTSKKYRLPTVVEWEYAARAGTAAPPAKLGDVAWYWDNADDKTWPVGKKPANAWGLFDTLGNTAEWAKLPDGNAVVCGGSFIDKAPEVGFGARKTPAPAWQQRDPQRPKSRWWLSDGPFVGFRVVCDD